MRTLAGVTFALLLIAHLSIAAYWFGALPALLIALRHDSSASVVARFSRHATWLVPWLAIAGVLLAFALLPTIAALMTPYGFALLAKIAGFLVLMLLAALNKLRLAPRAEQGETAAVAQLRIAMVCEYVIIVAVLTATATMTTMFSPE